MSLSNWTSSDSLYLDLAASSIINEYVDSLVETVSSSPPENHS